MTNRHREILAAELSRLNYRHPISAWEAVALQAIFNTVQLADDEARREENEAIAKMFTGWSMESCACLIRARMAQPKPAETKTAFIKSESVPHKHDRVAVPVDENGDIFASGQWYTLRDKPKQPLVVDDAMVMRALDAWVHTTSTNHADMRAALLAALHGAVIEEKAYPDLTDEQFGKIKASVAEFNGPEADAKRTIISPNPLSKPITFGVLIDALQWLLDAGGRNLSAHGAANLLAARLERACKESVT